MKILPLFFSLWLSIFPSQEITSTSQTVIGNEVIKTSCRQAINYQSLDALKQDLLSSAQRQAVNELFGELITASTTVENFTLTRDQILTSSAGLVRINGTADYYNGENLAEVCITIRAYATEQDREKFKPKKLTKRHCITEPELTASEIKIVAQEEAIVQALLAYDRELETIDKGELIHLLKEVEYIDSGFVPDTETYCTRVEGYILPVEIIALLETDTVTASIDTETETLQAVLNEDFDDNSIDQSMWKSEVLGTGVLIAEVNQQLEIIHGANAREDPDSDSFGSSLLGVCQLAGDFDIQVDYSLPAWAPANGIRLGLVVTPDPNGTDWRGVERVNNAGGYEDVYLVDFGGNVTGYTETTDLQGKLRLVRSGTLLTAFYIRNSDWITLFSGPVVTSDLYFSLSSWGHNSFFGHQEVHVAFDNFVIQKGILVCPQTSTGGIQTPTVSTNDRLNEEGIDSQTDSSSQTEESSNTQTFQKLSVNEAWETNGVSLKLDDYELRSDESVRFFLTLENKTNQSLHFEWSNDRFEAVDNLGNKYRVGSCAQPRRTAILSPGEKITLGICGSSFVGFYDGQFFKPEVTSITFTAKDVSRIDQAQWVVDVTH